MIALNHFTRMFPELERRPSTPGSELENGLQELGVCMRDDGKEDGNVLAGYTYLGQFIDHDLTLDLTPLDYAQVCEKQTPNFRTPFLDLDHVYGGGPNISPFLYQAKFPPGNERFLIGQTRSARGHGYNPSPNDLPRNIEGTALVGDPRQDENLIIAQLHLAFLKFHNLVIAGLEKGKIKSAGPEGATIFEQARRLVTWHYQYIVLRDFLATLLMPSVFEDVIKKANSPSTSAQDTFGIPIEFSVAAFRYGHSMVRDDYDYNTAQGTVSLIDLLNRTGSGPIGNVPLPEDWVIDWDRFFDLGVVIPSQDARSINTKIANGLHDLHLEIVKLYKVPRCDEPSVLVSPKNVLPVRTLWRGARVGLPSGQAVAEKLGFKPLEANRIAGGRHSSTLRKYKFHEDTPLWYYILKEAELEMKGAFLGPVGSRIVGDVILEALKADPNSYLTINPNWQPLLDGTRIDVLGNILLLVK